MGGAATIRLSNYHRFKNIDDFLYDSIYDDKILHLENSRAILVNKQALTHDFPGVFHNCDHASIADWMEKHLAVITESQVLSPRVNPKIATTGPAGFISRPPYAGRSGLLSVPLKSEKQDYVGFFDIKGCGIITGKVAEVGSALESSYSHTNGVLFLHDALREVLIQYIIDAIFSRHADHLRTVPFYGLLLTGFMARNLDGALYPTAILVRRAVRRQHNGFDSYPSGSIAHAAMIHVEQLIERFGMTTCSGGELLNVRKQGCVYKWFVHNTHRGTISEYDPGAVRATNVIQYQTGQHLTDLEMSIISVQMSRIEVSEPEIILIDFGHYFFSKPVTEFMITPSYDSAFEIGAIAPVNNCTKSICDTSYLNKNIADFCFDLSERLVQNYISFDELRIKLEGFADVALNVILA